MVLRFAHCPQHIGENTFKNGLGIADINPFSAGLTEMDYGNRTTIPQMQGGLGPKFQVLSKDQGGHSQDNCVVTRKRPVWVIDRVRVIQVSNDLGKGIGNDRWMLIVERHRRGSRKRKIAHIATHWNAAIQERSTGRRFNSDRAKAMNFASRRLESEIRTLKLRGFQVVVTGDFNYRMTGQSGKWVCAPENVFRRQGMKVINSGLDYLAYTRGLDDTNCQIIRPGKGGNHSDHPWIVVDFKWAA